jgi:hypothetical protein
VAWLVLLNSPLCLIPLWNFFFKDFSLLPKAETLSNEFVTDNAESRLALSPSSFGNKVYGFEQFPQT